MHLWFLLAGLGGLASNISNLTIRIILKDGDDAITFGWLFDIFRVVFALFIFPFDNKLFISTTSLIVFFLTMISGTISTYFYVRMHQYTQLSLSTILSRLRIIWTPLLAYLFIHERLIQSDYLSIIIVFIGIALVVTPKELIFDKGVHFALGFSIFGATNVIMTKEALHYISTSGVIILSSIATIGVFPLFMKSPQKRITTSLKTMTKQKFLCFFLNSIASYCFIYALVIGGSASGVNVVYQSMMVISVLYGIFILREKEMVRRKILGTIVTILGIIGLNH